MRNNNQSLQECKDVVMRAMQAVPQKSTGGLPWARSSCRLVSCHWQAKHRA